MARAPSRTPVSLTPGANAITSRRGIPPRPGSSSWDKGGKLHTMKSNGTDQHPFDPEALDSRLWLSDKTVPFTLQWKQSGDRWKIYRSDPQGRHEQLIYEALGSSISPPQWAADGQRVAFIVNDGQGSTVMSVSSDGKWPLALLHQQGPRARAALEPRWPETGLAGRPRRRLAGGLDR